MQLDIFYLFQDTEAIIVRDLHRTLPNHIFFRQGNPGYDC